MKVAGWTDPPGVLPVRAVKFEAQFNGETADVRVTVLRGREGFLDQEDLVATYHIGLDDPRVVKKLSEVGIEPARITLLHPAPMPSLWPGVVNKTTAVNIEKIEIESNPLPGYRVYFRNNSEKPIAALRVDVTKDQRGPISAFLQGEDGRPLIPPAALSDRYLPAITEVVAGNQSTPVTATPNTIVVTSAVFADGTFDGDVEPACDFEGFQVGRKIWLRAVLSLVNEQLTESQSSGPDAATSFKEKLIALQYQFSGPDVLQQSGVSASCRKIRTLAEIAVKGQKLQLLRELDDVITTRPAPPVNFKTWLEAKQKRYAEWLARL